MSTTQKKTVYSHLHPTPSWESGEHQVPSGREETWRFTPLDNFVTLFDPSRLTPLEWSIDAPEGVHITTATQAQAQELSWDAPVDIVALNAVTAAGDHACVVTVDANAELARPIVVDVTSEQIDAAGHLIISIGENAQATIVLKHQGNAQIATKVEIHAAPGSHVDLVSMQDWSAGSVHGGQVSIKVGRDAEVRTIQASIGAGNVRLVERAEYDGTGGRLEQLGLYFVRSRQHVEHRLFVDHNAPHTDSHVDYRGALQGKGAHSVWIGDVLIRSVATDIETYETNKNLMLTEGCQADSVPNLEIETGEIRGAGHSSSTGRFDEEQLFYLRSRGIPEEQARRLIVEGFFLDIIHRIHVDDIEQRLVEALNEQLSQVEGMTAESILSDPEGQQ